jgi:hypothetical protein
VREKLLLHVQTRIEWARPHVVHTGVGTARNGTSVGGSTARNGKSVAVVLRLTSDLLSGTARKARSVVMLFFAANILHICSVIILMLQLLCVLL